MPSPAIGYATDAEWLEADGLGGFASGTVGGARTRRYHALLLAATTPPTGRMVLVNGVEAWLETAAGRYALSAQRYAPDVAYPDGDTRIVAFALEPWPAWTFRAEDGTEVSQEIVTVRDRTEVVLRWRLLAGEGATKLVVRPLLSGRDYHGLHHENPSFAFAPVEEGAGRVVWRPYPGVPAIRALSSGAYAHAPDWYRNFLYTAERERGLDDIEDLASPGSFTFDLAAGDDAVLILAAGERTDADDLPGPAADRARRLLEAEAHRRGALGPPLHRAAEAYVARRGPGRTVIAGYPWFTDWGRDTFIALRGLLAIPGGLDIARDILVAWSGTDSRGMLPNRFPDAGEALEYNSVDAALWYVVAAHDFLATADAASVEVAEPDRRALREAIARIIDGHRRGSRHGVGVDADGLLAAGEPGVQLTWMDAKIRDRVVTPRIGKPVEVQALWLNALAIGDGPQVFAEAKETFRTRFWNAERGCLRDVVDVDHVPGRDDPTLRPNQILAVGGLPFQVLDGPEAEAVVAAVERELVTPMGLRSLAPGEPGYRPRYEGGPLERDSGYHQGTVWPWLMGPFVEAWLRIRGATMEARREAAARFVLPLQRTLREAGVGHLSEIADAEAPHAPRGAPFQAWSLGELLRMRAMLGDAAPALAEEKGVT